MDAVRDLVPRLLAGEPRALARAISIVEDRRPAAREIMKAIAASAGRAALLGVTGPPGAGKSTLVDGLAALLRSEKKKVGIIAVDPSSAFSGGAVLGDRIRMQRHSTDPGVFIRSMATRGNFGGLAAASVDVADLMSAAGCDVVLIETVGVGQDEVEVVRVADLVMVVLVPGLGDDIQTIKAGIMEIPDIFVLNKADREGIERLHSDVQSMLSLAEHPGGRTPAIVRTVGTTGEGLPELLAAVEAAPGAAGEPAQARRRERSRERLLDLLKERVMEWVSVAPARQEVDRLAGELAQRSIDPHAAADVLMARLTGGARG
ncbi:MAG TPA: methylmalonyl Co-A mutase-associated GTPase MeaB [Candidatus Polarisedimenticolia bacterium]|nr:methylmalonyl Co-A mutase-associated GTPase MeaB [Candidatus Polarisedimenticolia bacterium]